MAATLRGPNGQSVLEPTSYPFTIGRSPDNQLAVHDAKVSSHHTEIRFQGQGYEIIDLGSSNGTFVNEQRLTPYAPRLLSNGDQIRLGDSRFLFEAGAMPSQPPIEATVYGGSGQGSNPSYQSQETEAQFAANFKSVTVNDCTVSNVNDTAGTDQITYTLNGTNVGAFDYTLVNENNTWKINSEKQHA